MAATNALSAQKVDMIEHVSSQIAVKITWDVLVANWEALSRRNTLPDTSQMMN